MSEEEAAKSILRRIGMTEDHTIELWNHPAGNQWKAAFVKNYTFDDIRKIIVEALHVYQNPTPRSPT